MKLLKRSSKALKSITIALSTFVIMACGDGKDPDKTLVLGFGPSTYAEQFEKGIRPILEADGYDVTVKILSQNMQINPALKDKSIDVAGHQSIAYMEEMNKELGMNMVKLVDTASAPQSLRSNKHKSLSDVKAGMTVAIPNDPVNAERAARILENIGWIEVLDGEISNFSERDIKSLNGVKVLFLDPALGLRILEDVDFAVINGNYVANAGLQMTDALVIEETPSEHVVIISIRGEDQDTSWAKALKAAYESKEYEAYIKNEPLYNGFILPTAWRD